MSNSCNQTSAHSNTTENAENIGWVKNTPLQWSKFNQSFILILQSARVPKRYPYFATRRLTISL